MYPRRLYIGQPPSQYQSPGGSGDLTTECGSCRQKIAQATFDMTAGFNQSDLITKTLSTRDRIELERRARRSGSPDIHFNTPEHPVNLQRPTIEEICYGGGCDTVTPGYVPVDVIDVLNGERTILNPPGNPIDDSSFPVHVGDPPSGTKPNTDLPCLRSEDDTFHFPNDNFFLPFYLNSTNLHNCMYFFTLIDTSGDIGKIILVEADLSDCCKTFTEDMWCAPNTIEIAAAYDAFNDCVSKASWKAYYDKFKNKVVPPGIFIQFNNKLQDLWDSINSDKIWFLGKPEDYYSQYTGMRVTSSFSCFCKKKNDPNYTEDPRFPDPPTYCCFPDYPGGAHRAECYCNGKLKDLCEICWDDTIYFELPYSMRVSCKDYICPGIEASPKNKNSKETGILINYKITCPNGIEYTSTPIDTSKLNPKDGNYENKRILPVGVLNSGICRIEITYKFPCGYCCNNENKERTETIVKDFSLSEYNSWDQDKKDDFLKLKSVNNEKVFRDEFFSEKYCKFC